MPVQRIAAVVTALVIALFATQHADAGPRDAMARRSAITRRAQSQLRRTPAVRITASLPRVAPTRTAGPRPALRLARRWSTSDRPEESQLEMGPVYERNAVVVRHWQWTANEVDLVLEDTGEHLPMNPGEHGVWEARIPTAPSRVYGRRYHFEVDGRAISDPYGHASGGSEHDYLSSIFVDVHPTTARPRNARPVTANQQVISEVNIRDLTMDPGIDVPDELRGTFLGAAQPAVVNHFVELGVTSVEFEPFHEFHETEGTGLVDGHETSNHWGYMSRRFRALATRYARRPEHAVSEAQEMIDAYHTAGIGVIMDVVVNHTAGGSTMSFHMGDRAYHYRMTPDEQHYFDGTGTGNELNTASPMMRRMIVDMASYAKNVLGVDGLRFDLMASVDTETLRQVERAVGGEHFFITGEPWTADWNRSQWRKGDLAHDYGSGNSLADTHLSVWDDTSRESYRGSLMGAHDRGDYATRDRLKTTIAGAAGYFGWARRPSQSTKYIVSHDEHALAHELGGNPSRVVQASAMLLTSQGPRMLQQGVELMDTKDGLGNTYNRDEPNWMRWSGKARNPGVFSSISRIANLVTRLPQFHHDRALNDQDIHWIEPGNANGLGYELPHPADAPRTAQSRDVVVLHNSDPSEWITFHLPAGSWGVAVHGTETFAEGHEREASGDYHVPPNTSVVLTRPVAATH